jgi:hypothetical protein
VAAVDVALATAEAIIRGSITQATVTSEVVVLRREREFLPLARSPVVSVTSVAIGTDAALNPAGETGYTVEPFGLRRKHPYVWPAGTRVVVTYVVGWASNARPADITQALVLLEAWANTRPEAGIASVKVGEESTTFRSDAGAMGAPEAARQLLARYVRHA